jgi:outer membrane murein-binding lipoprotein Lpp
MRRTFVVLSALAVAGCVTTGTPTGTTGTTAKVDVLPSELQKSIAEYRACVDAKGRVKVCEAQRLSMEAEERAYFNRSSGTQGGTSASNVNIQSR